MSILGWYLAKLKTSGGGGKETLNKYLRSTGIKIGKNTKTASALRTSEPYLIEIGDNVTISHGVDFITHDNSVCKIFGVDHDLYGKVVIGNNCFLGAHSVILYGVEIADNVIVAAGSVVTHSIAQEYVIVGGNPARVIGTWDSYKQKMQDYEIHAGNLSAKEKYEKIQKHPEKMIRRKLLT